MRGMRLLPSVRLGCLFAAGCIVRAERPYPLYPVGELRPGPSAVARLGGYVRFVDGADVSKHGTSFELLPGCHVVGTPSQWGSIDSNAGGVSATTGTWVFVLATRAGYNYTIDVDTAQLTVPSGAMEPILAQERNAQGEATGTFSHATNVSDSLAACRSQL